MDNYTYNLTKIVSTDIVNDPTSWFYNYNAELGGFIIVAFLLVIGIILFILAREAENIKDTKAALYSGIIMSVIALLLFFIEVDGNKLLSFSQLMIFLGLTAMLIIADKIMSNW